MPSRPVIAATKFTTTGTFTVDNSAMPVRSFSIQAKGQGAAATTWSVNVEGSNDGLNWTNILTHANADTDGVTKAQAAGVVFPCLFVRLNCTSLTLGAATSLLVIAVAAE